MDHRRLRTALSIALAATFACMTVHLPQNDPITEATLGEAIETLRESEGRVELLEDGIVVDLYVYEWRRVEKPQWRDPRELRVGGGIGTTHYKRLLVGPKREVYLPYTSILAVQARSWPLWSGVELELDSAFQLRESSAREAPPWRAGGDGPVVIKARDEQEAQKLSEAIDRLRRARLLTAPPTDSPAAADAPEAAPREGVALDAAAQ